MPKKLNYAPTVEEKNDIYKYILTELQAGQYVPRSQLVNAKLYNENSPTHVIYTLQPYLDNGQIFDDSARKYGLGTVGGDLNANDNTDFGFTLPADIGQDTLTLGPVYTITNPTTEQPSWLFVDRSAESVVPLLANNNGVTDSIIANAKPNTAIAVPASEIATASAAADLQNASNIYDNSLPPVITNSLVTLTNSSNTSLYVLLGLIVCAIAYKKINFKHKK